MPPECEFSGSFEVSCSNITYSGRQSGITGCLMNAQCQASNGTRYAAQCSSEYCVRYGMRVQNVGGKMSCSGASDGISVCDRSVSGT